MIKVRARSLRSYLSGGDRRSIAESSRVWELVRARPSRVSELAALAEDADALVAQRALDLLEKLAHERPKWVEPHKHLFIGPLADSGRWEIRLQVVRALPLFTWTAGQRRRVIDILLRDVAHSQKFVKAWALDSLAQLAKAQAPLRPTVLRHIRAFERSSSPALRARARHARAHLSR